MSLGCLPAPVYKGARGEAAGLGRRRAKGGVLLPPGVGLLLFLLEKKRGLVGLLLSLLEKKRGGEGEGKGAAPLVQFGPEVVRRPPSFWPLSSIPVWPNKAHILPGEFP